MMQELWSPLRSNVPESSRLLWRGLFQSRSFASLRQHHEFNYDRLLLSKSFIPVTSSCYLKPFYSSHNAQNFLQFGNSSPRFDQRSFSKDIYSSGAVPGSTNLKLRLFENVPGVSPLSNVNLDLFNKQLFVHDQIRFLHQHSARRRVSRTFSSQNKSTPSPADADNNQTDEKKLEEANEDGDQKLSVYQRFKKTYKEHGKVLVAVHLLTSSVWIGTFYTAAKCGVDVVPLLESWNLSEKFISPFRSGGLGSFALAYLMYKLATPARYTVTLGGTNLVIRRLKKQGKMQQVPKEDSLRELYKDGKENLKSKGTDTRHRLRHMRHRIQGRIRRVRRRYPRDRKNH